MTSKGSRPPTENLVLPTEGLKLLRNWHKAKAVLVVPSVSFKGHTEFFEVRARILAVDEYTLALSRVDGVDENETFDIRGAEFFEAPLVAIELRLTNGGALYMEEAGGMASGQRSSAAHLATGRLEGSRPTKTTRAAMAQRRKLRPIATHPSQPCVELRFPGGADNQLDQKINFSSQLTAAIQAGGRPRRLPDLVARRSSAIIASPICSRSCCRSEIIFEMSTYGRIARSSWAPASVRR
jgi:hypothetical protein